MLSPSAFGETTANTAEYSLETTCHCDEWERHKVSKKVGEKEYRWRVLGFVRKCLICKYVCQGNGVLSSFKEIWNLSKKPISGKSAVLLHLLGARSGQGRCEMFPVGNLGFA